MKKWLTILVCVFLTGCSTVDIPNYIKDDHPYNKIFYADYDTIVASTLESLNAAGWKVSKKTDPVIYEGSRVLDDPMGKQVLIFTNLRQNALILATRYRRINVYIRTVNKNATEVEIRYVTITSTSLKNFTSYKKDRAVERLFQKIDELLI